MVGGRYRVREAIERFAPAPGSGLAGAEFEYWCARDERRGAEVWLLLADSRGAVAAGADVVAAVGVLRLLDHPAVPTVLEVGEVDAAIDVIEVDDEVAGGRSGRAAAGAVVAAEGLLPLGYAVLEPVEGDCLADLLLSGQLTEAELVAALLEIADLLKILHDLGFVHGHLSAYSALVGDAGLLLMDLPAALALEAAEAGGLTAAADVYAFCWLACIALIGAQVVEAEFGGAAGAQQQPTAELVGRRRAWAEANLVEVFGLREDLAAILVAGLGEASRRPPIGAVAAGLRGVPYVAEATGMAEAAGAAGALGVAGLVDVVEAGGLAGAALAVGAARGAEATHAGDEDIAGAGFTSEAEAAIGEAVALFGAGAGAGIGAAAIAGAGRGGEGRVGAGAGQAESEAAGLPGQGGESAGSGASGRGAAGAAAGVGAAGTIGALYRSGREAGEVVLPGSAAGGAAGGAAAASGSVRGSAQQARGYAPPSAVTGANAAAAASGGGAAAAKRRPNRPRSPFYVALGIVVVALIGLAIYFSTSGGGSPAGHPAAAASPTLSAGSSAGASAGTGSTAPAVIGQSASAGTGGSAPAAGASGFPAGTPTPGPLATVPGTPGAALTQIEQAYAELKHVNQLPTAAAGPLTAAISQLGQEITAGTSIVPGSTALQNALAGASALPQWFKTQINELIPFLVQHNGS